MAVIILGRHPSILLSIPEIFGVDNHACGYHNLNENFISFYSKQSTRGSKRKDNALQWLDKIVYVRVDIEYMFRCMNYVSSMTCLQHGLSKMNLNIR